MVTSTKKTPTAAQRVLRTAQWAPLVLITGYLAVLSLFFIPVIQRELLYLHRLDVPFFADLQQPHRFGLAPHKARHLWLNTSDGERLGAWQLLPHSSYKAQRPFPPESPMEDTAFERALAERPTIIYFHGNTGSRALNHRVRGISAFSTTLDLNVLAVEYRGFGDSSGSPSETGLLLDARAAWDHVHSALIRQGKTAAQASDQIILVGQSLGTGVVAGLAGQLAREGTSPRALVSVASFSSLPDTIIESGFWLFRMIPVLRPLKSLPFLQNFFVSHWKDTWNSLAALGPTKCPVLLLHAADDEILLRSHSTRIFNALSNATHPTAPITEKTYEGWATIRSFPRGKGTAEVVFWEGITGGHNNILWAEGTLDLINRIARL